MDNQTPENPSDEHSEINVGKDVSDSVIITGSGNVINVVDKKAPRKPRRKASPKKKPMPNTAIIVAVIAFLGTVIAALLNSPVLVNVEPTPTSTSTTIPETSTTFVTPTIFVTPTESATPTEYLTATPILVVATSTEVTSTASPTFTFTPTPEDTVTASPSSEPRIETMTAVLQSTVYEGNAPLKVNFDARSSYVKLSTGSLVPCGNQSCSYLFAIYRDNKFLERVSNTKGVLSYTLNGRGLYSITVYTCRDNACDNDGLTVNVK